jgi:hypothetical protein
MIIDSIGQILHWNFHLQDIIEDRIERMMEGTGRRRSRPKQLLYDLKKKKGYWKLMGEALDSSLWRTCIGSNYGAV